MGGATVVSMTHAGELGVVWRHSFDQACLRTQHVIL
jgi:hypothetical protein